jgi:hypothetical protein
MSKYLIVLSNVLLHINPATFFVKFLPKLLKLFLDPIQIKFFFFSLSITNYKVHNLVFTISGCSQTINFTNNLSNINYGVLITLGTDNGSTPFVSHGFYTVKEMEYVTISIVDASGQLVSAVSNGVTVVIFSS